MELDFSVVMKGCVTVVVVEEMTFEVVEVVMAVVVTKLDFIAEVARSALVEGAVAVVVVGFIVVVITRGRQISTSGSNVLIK